jgi:hypothetical protein
MKTIVLESAKGVKGNKVQLCFSQMVDLGQKATNVLGLLNASDERFSQSKPRYAWLTAEPTDVKKQFDIDVTDLAEGSELEIGLVDPRMAAYPEVELNIQIVETTEGTPYDVANFETRAKRAGKDGDFIMKDDLYIYVRTSVVVGTAKHVVLQDTVRKSAGFSAESAIASALND